MIPENYQVIVFTYGIMIFFVFVILLDWIVTKIKNKKKKDRENEDEI